MPLNVQLVNAQVKDPQSGQMTPAGLIGSDAISTINTAKNQAIAAVQQKGEETLQSIPDDYTALSNEVDEVKTQLNRNKTAVPGYLMRATNDGLGTEWAPIGTPTDAQAEAAINAWLEEHPEATTTVEDNSLTFEKLVNGTLGFVTPEMFGSKGDGVTDDTNAIRSMFSYGFANSIKNFCFSYGKTYLVSTLTNESIGTQSFAYIHKFNGANNICIFGNNSTIKISANTVDSVHSAIFMFDSCNNVKIEGLTFESANYDPATLRPIVAGVYCIKNNYNFTFNIVSNNIRYGFKSGLFADATVTGTEGICSSKITVNASDTGYPVAIEEGTNLNIMVESLNAKRACYLCGVSNSTIMVDYITNDSAGNNVYLKDNISGKGCNNLLLYVHDKGSTSNSACLTIGAYSNEDFIHTNQFVDFSNIVAFIETEENSFVQPFSFTFTGATPTPIHVSNIDINIVDNSTETEHQLTSIRGFPETSSCKGFRLSAQTPKDVYLGNKNTDNITFEMHDSKCRRIYFTNSSKNNKYKLKNIDMTSIVVDTSTTEEIETNMPTSNYELLTKCSNYKKIDKNYGNTANRPAAPNIGFMYFDTTLNKVIFYKEYNTWVDATGTVAN